MKDILGKAVIPVLMYLLFLCLVWNVEMTTAADISRIHALNFAGAHYHCSPLENAKPFSALVFYFCPADQYKYINALFLVLLVLAFASISRSITGSRAAGIAASFLFIASNRVFSEVLLNPTMLIYVVFMLWAIAFYLEGRYKATAVMLLLAGLNRPDAWLIALVFAFKRFRVGWIALLAPVLWAAFDFKASGDALLASHQIVAFTVNHGFNTFGFPGLCRVIVPMCLDNSYGLPLLPIGIVTLIFAARKYDRSKIAVLPRPM